MTNFFKNDTWKLVTFRGKKKSDYFCSLNKVQTLQWLETKWQQTYSFSLYALGYVWFPENTKERSTKKQCKGKLFSHVWFTMRSTKKKKKKVKYN